MEFVGSIIVFLSEDWIIEVRYFCLVEVCMIFFVFVGDLFGIVLVLVGFEFVMIEM